MDAEVLHWLNQSIAHPALDPIMIGLSLSLLLLPAFGLALLFTRHRRAGVGVLIGLALSWSATMIAQCVVLRPRPAGALLAWPAPDFPSYPSGHAAMSFCVALVVTLVFRRARIAGPAFAGAALISLSRVYLGHHYPSDVLGGAVVGLGIGAACYGLIASPARKTAALGWLVWPQLAVVFVASQLAYLDLLPPYLLNWPYSDKLLHFLLFGMVAFWLNVWLNGKSLRLFRPAVSLPLAVVVPFGVAVVEECLQALSTIRTASLADLAFDLFGMLVFWWLSRTILARRQQLTLPRVQASSPAGE